MQTIFDKQRVNIANNERYPNPLPHTTKLQQTTSKTSKQTCGFKSKYIYYIELKALWVALGRIAHYQQFLLLAKCFQNLLAADGCIKRSL